MFKQGWGYHTGHHMSQLYTHVSGRCVVRRRRQLIDAQQCDLDWLLFGVIIDDIEQRLSPPNDVDDAATPD